MATTVKGGRYIVDGKTVDAFGKPLKDQAAATEEPKGTPKGDDPLAGVDLTSDAAVELAKREKLTAADFSGVKPSGKTGYTKGDVELIAEKKKGGK